ncbi:MAG: hypothetical protein GKR89_01615 [Candidatus Latescibacteria bacterium]|nr:hypothetical protein [Candidatus Latescibacterota bacterium]
MEQSIHGKVAHIIDATTLVLNIGADQGVQLGMVFAVFAEHQEVVDPDSGQVLGRWEVVKAQVEATHVQERMCTVRSLPQNEEGQIGSAPLSTLMVEHSRGHYGDGRNSERRRLEVNSGQMSGTPKTSPIAVGDKVRCSLQPQAGGSETDSPQEA